MIYCSLDILERFVILNNVHISLFETGGGGFIFYFHFICYFTMFSRAFGRYFPYVKNNICDSIINREEEIQQFWTVLFCFYQVVMTDLLDNVIMDVNFISNSPCILVQLQTFMDMVIIIWSSLVDRFFLPPNKVIILLWWWLI